MEDNKEKILFYSSNIWSFAEGLFGPLLVVFADWIGGNILDIAWAWATYLIITGLMIMVVGRISDKSLSKEKILLLGLGINTIFTFSYLLVSSPVHLFIVQIGLGIGTALSWPTWDALYSKYQDKDKIGYSWGKVDGAEQILTGIAIIIGGIIVTYISFYLLFILMGSVLFITTIYQAKILKNN